MPCLNALALRRSVNEDLWQPLLTDLDKAIQMGSVNNIQVYYLLRALHTVGLLQSELTKTLVDYVVKRGYDSDDLL